MTLKRRFYQDQKIMLTNWSGGINDADLIHFYMAIYNNSHWQPGFSEVIDLRDANLKTISDEALRHLSELATGCLKGEGIKLALIAPSELSSDVIRLYEAFTHIPNEATQVFHHLDEALEWLS